MSAPKKRVRKPAGKRASKEVSVPTAAALAELRARIDRIDDELLALLTERARVAQQVGKAKGNGSPVHVPEREQAIIRRLLSRNDGPLSAGAVEQIFREIFSASLALQRRLKVSFLGPEGTFTHEAARKYFGRAPEFVPAVGIGGVFDDVERKRADYGVVPIENSTEGSITATTDRLLETDAKVCAEVVLEIHHSLYRARGVRGKLKRIYSHPQALAQCASWLRQNEPQAELVPTLSTAEAARHAASEKSAAALSSREAAALHGLEVYARNTEDRSDNQTRFLVLGRHDTKPSGFDRTSLALSVKDEPGVLARILQPFAKRNLSLTRIESRPAAGRPWEYVFFIDVAGHEGDRPVSAALKEVERRCRYLRVLGSFPRAL